MDGFKLCPVDHGACGEEELLTKASGIIQQFMARDPDNIQFSMLVLAKNSEEWWRENEKRKEDDYLSDGFEWFYFVVDD